MKKVLLFLVILVWAISLLKAQNVAINESGNSPNSHAILDVNADQNHDKGILLPRMTTTQRTSMSLGSSETGLTVYDTDTKSYWWWDGSQWLETETTGTCWNLNGNDGVTSSNFLGTINDQSLIFKTNNSTRMTLLNTGELILYPIDNGIEGGELRFNGAGSYRYFYIDNNEGNFRIVTQDASDESTKVLVTNSGNVGIGDITPDAKLDIEGKTRIGQGNYLIFSHNESGQEDFGIRVQGENLFITEPEQSDKKYMSFYDDNRVSIGVGSDVLNVTDSRVGIGTTSPSETFSVGSSSQFRVNSSGNLVRINNLQYNWPTSQGEPNSLLMNDGSGNLTWEKSGWTAIEVVDLNNVTSYTISGLNGNDEVNYKIVLMGQQQTVSGNSSYCLVRPNGDSDADNYSYGMDAWWRYLDSGGSGWNYNPYVTSGILLYITDGHFNPNYVEIETILSAFTGNRRHAVTRYSLHGNSKDIIVNLSAGVWQNATDNITSLTFIWGTAFTGKLILYATH